MESNSMPWRAMFAGAAVPLSVIDTTGRLVAWNEACAEMLGYPYGDLGALDVGRITRPEDQAWTRRYLMRLMSGEIDRFETDKIYVRGDGSEVRTRLTCRAIADADGHCTHIVATNVPLTEDAATVPHGAAERLLEFGSETLSLVDPDGSIRLLKGGESRIQGYPSSFWRDRKVAEVLAPGEWERVEEPWDALVATPGASFEFEVEMVAGDGDARTIVNQVTNCIDDPALNGMVVVSRDVTEERATTAELTRRRRSAEAVGDARTRLLATVSHELRNPLHAVHGLAELLVDEDLSPRASELARSLVRQIASLTRVTEDLLDTARLDAGTAAIEPAPTELAAVVADVVDLARAGVGDNPVTVTSRIAHGVPDWVEVDADRLRQVLTNLLGNGVKFTERGSVQLVVRPDGPGTTAFSVIDNGVGIPAAEQTTILEPFTVGSTAGSARGAGLGLAIVQRLVVAMGGRLTLTSTVGAGSRFDVSLPLPRCDAPEPDRELEELGGVRVLVVEDNPVNRQLAQRQLERLGVDAVVVETGEEGYARLIDEPTGTFDVILMDHQLPGWSGVETTEHIRSLDGPRGDTPIVGVSASSAVADRARFLAAGMDDLVAKPATLGDLAEAIRRVVREQDAIAVGARSRGSGDAPRGDDAVVDDAVADDGAGDEVTLDRSALEQLEDDLGDAEIVAELVATFLSELDDRVAAITSPDGEVSRRAAHTLQSSARLLGVTALADACRQVEQGLADGAVVAALAARSRARLGDWLYDRPR